MPSKTIKCTAKLEKFNSLKANTENELDYYVAKRRIRGGEEKTTRNANDIEEM